MASAGIRKTPTGRYKVWWRLDDGSQGSQTFGTRDAARDFKNDLLARLAPRGDGAAAPGGALRAIDSSARPRSWRTCGPRRLRRQFQSAAVATWRGAE